MAMVCGFPEPNGIEEDGLSVRGRMRCNLQHQFVEIVGATIRQQAYRIFVVCWKPTESSDL